MKNAAAKSTAKVAEVGGAEETVNSLDFQCSQCDLHFNAEEELKIHMKEKHTIPNLSTPEKERLPDQTGDLILTPVCGERSEEVASLDPPKELELGLAMRMRNMRNMRIMRISEHSERPFSTLETRSRISSFQSHASRQDREFLPFSLRLRDEIENFFLSVSGFETRSRISFS